MSWSLDVVGKRDAVKAEVQKLGNGDPTLEPLRAFLSAEVEKFNPSDDAYNNAVQVTGSGHSDSYGVSASLQIKTVHLAACLMLIASLAAIMLVGCVTKNPDYTGPNTNGIPQFTADLDKINAMSNSVAGVSRALAPVNPYAGITDYVVNGVFGLTALLSGLWARHKSQVADTIAAGAVKAGPTAISAILDHAADTTKFASVAALVNENTGANQTVTGIAKAPGV